MSRMQNIARPSGGRSDAPAKEVRGAQAPVKTLKRLLKYCEFQSIKKIDFIWSFFF